MSDTALAPVEYMILTIRGHRVMLDADLAALYGVPIRQLNQAYKRNIDRFPLDFAFQLTSDEWTRLKSQIVTSNDSSGSNENSLRSRSYDSLKSHNVISNEETGSRGGSLKSQVVTDWPLWSHIASSAGRGGRRTPPMAFTQEGVAMLSGILNSPRAIQTNIEIMRAFVRLRTDVLSYADLTKRLDALEARYDDTFAVVFEALRDLMAQPPVEEKERRMGFRVNERRKRYEASLR